ncbi:hypothetical protein BDV29DRAFT_159519 [Aspergillus leporis]|uniref:Uncharacterized protein n=1 Tax=Aspergillus leporis TaxID=41062 RepID=A0A5N5WUI2_9EURO|nr:hypothetical protein BDV29DRAFT_159519 [Aspergillus leporis]
MATALLCLDNLVSKSEGKLRAMRHASHTFRLLQPNINRQSAVTDLAITAVISMAQYEHQQQSPTREMLRVDLEYALQLGSPNMFRLEEAETGCMGMTQFASVCLQSDHEEYLPISQQYLFKALPIHLRDLLLDVLFLVSVLNNAMTGISSKNGRY